MKAFPSDTATVSSSTTPTKQLEEVGLRIAGVNPERDLVEIVEVADHPWFVGVQFHPEFQSKPNKAHPLFAGFVEAALAHNLAAKQKGAGAGAT